MYWNVIVIEADSVTKINSEPYDVEQIAAMLDTIEAATIVLLRTDEDSSIEPKRTPTNHDAN